MHEEENFDFTNDSPTTTTDNSSEPITAAPEAPKKRHRIKVSQLDFILIKQHLIDFIQKQWLYLLIGVVAIIIGYYMIFEVIFVSPQIKKPVQKPSVMQQTPMTTTNQNAKPKLDFKPTQQLSANKEKANQTQSNALMISQKNMKKLLNGFSNAVSGQIQALSTSNHDMLTKLEKSLSQQSTHNNALLAKTLSQVEDQVENINQKFNQYNRNLKQLSSVLSKTQTELKLLLAEKAEHLKKLTLRAIIPGRAWLVDDEGKTISVTKGSKLKNYGAVTKIDNGAAKVYMSSGYVFS